MALFGKKEACPVCGDEVKGLFNKKISGKKVLCKNCSDQVSMTEELLKNATVGYIKDHLEYRQKNAIKYNALRWDMKFEVRGLYMGVDPGAGFLYLIHEEMDDEENPVVFSFDQITHYELYRLKKKIDDSDTPGDTSFETGFTVLAGISKLAGKSNNNVDYFRLVLTTTDPYWPEIEVKIKFNSPDDVYGIFGFGKDLKEMCQIFKKVVRKEQII